MTLDEFCIALERFDQSCVDAQIALREVLDGLEAHGAAIGIEPDFARRVIAGRLKSRMMDAREGRQTVERIRQMIGSMPTAA
jgi:hypothetical protein